MLSAERDDPNSKSFATLRREIEADRKRGLDTGGKEVDLYGKLAIGANERAASTELS